MFGNILAVLDYFIGLQLAFMVTKFLQEVQVKGITNCSLLEYMTARVLYIDRVWLKYPSQKLQVTHTLRFFHTKPPPDRE